MKKINNFIILFFILLIFFGLDWSLIFRVNREYGGFRDNYSLLNTKYIFTDLEEINTEKYGAVLFNLFLFYLTEKNEKLGILFLQIISVSGLLIQKKIVKSGFQSSLLILNPFVITSFMGNLRNGFAFFIYQIGYLLGKSRAALVFFFLGIFLHQSLILILLIDFIPDRYILILKRIDSKIRYLFFIFIIIATYFSTFIFANFSSFRDIGSNFNTTNNQLIVISPWLLFLFFVSDSVKYQKEWNVNEFKLLVKIAVFIGISFIVAGYYRYFSFLILSIGSLLYKLSVRNRFLFLFYYILISLVLFYKWS